MPSQEGVIELMEQISGDIARIEELQQDFEQFRGELDGLILQEVYGLITTR